MKKKQLRKSELRALQEKVEAEFGPSDWFDTKSKVEEIEKEGWHLISSENKPILFFQGKRLVPTLKLCLEKNILNNVTVDMGAVKFVASGADVMRPGIVEVDENILKDDFIKIIDINNKKPLAIGIALFDADEIISQEKGKMIKSIHYIGDKLWNIEL